MVGGLYNSAASFAPLITALKANRPAVPIDARPFLTGCLQQAASFVAAHSAVPAPQLCQFLSSAFALQQRVAESIVTCLVDHNILICTKEQLALSPKALLMLHNKSLHRTFGAQGGSPIVDRKTLLSIGRAMITPQSIIRLGGKGRAFTAADSFSGRILSSPVGGGTPSFGSPAPSTFQAIALASRAKIGPSVRA
jgi:hypothetical protein